MRAIWFLCIFLSLGFHVYMFVALLGIYVVYYRSAEAILPALCVDAFFGSEYFIPFYTLITTVALAGTLWIAPFLVMYNERV